MTEPTAIRAQRRELPHGIALNCRVAGPEHGPLVVFLHGFPEAAFVWDDLLQHFAQPVHGGHRCVAPNLRGYEHSSAPADVASYRAKHLVQDIQALIEAEASAAGRTGEPITLVAHDWGGALAWALAAQHPHLRLVDEAHGLGLGVVFKLVGMAFDGEGVAVIGLQPLRLLFQGGDRLRAQAPVALGDLARQAHPPRPRLRRPFLRASCRPATRSPSAAPRSDWQPTRATRNCAFCAAWRRNSRST